MKKKHDPPPVRDRLPAMFVGDELTGSLPAQTQETAAMLPDDLRVVIEATSAGRLLLIVVGLLAVLVLGVLGMGGMDWLEGQILLASGPVALLAWLAHRSLVRRRKEFRLLDSGITVQVTPLTGGPPRTAHVPWTEIADYTISVEPDKAFLHVMSVRGYTLTLKDRPARSATREFIRRFVEQADRYPRAVQPTPGLQGSRLPDVTGERHPALDGCATILGVVLLNSALETFLDPSFAQRITGLAVLGVIGFAAYVWWTLDDPEIAGSDAESNRLIASLRRWLRRVLRIRAG